AVPYPYNPVTAATPSNIDRSFESLTHGDVIGFNFPSRPNPFAFSPGTVTQILVVKTNATSYVPGTISVIDGRTADVNGFAPGVPLPATASMGLVLLAGLGG